MFAPGLWSSCIVEFSASGNGGSSSSDGFMLLATGIENLRGLLEYRCAAIIGLSCA